MNTESIIPVLVELLGKSVAITFIAVVLARVWRGAPAAQRHLMGIAALTAITLLPVTRLVSPRWTIPVQPAHKVTVIMASPTVPVESTEFETVPSGTVTPSVVSAPPDWRKIVLGVWVAGSVLILAHRLFGSWRLSRLKRRSLPLEDARLGALADKILREMKAGPRTEVRISRECRVPVTWGILRPVMLLPAAALDWSDAWVAAALRHEAAHIRRHDYFSRWIARIACAIYWPNPLVWLLARSLRVTQEQAADDLVLRAGTPAEEYATQLVDAARLVARHGLFVGQAVAMACPSTLEDRVRAIVDGRRDRRPLSRLAASVGSVAVAFALALCAAAQLVGDDQTPTTKPPESDGATGTAPAKVPAPKPPQIEINAVFVEAEPAALSVDGKTPLNIEKATYSDPQFQIIMRVLHEKKGVDVLSAPRLTTRANQRSVIEIIREFRYAMSWEKDAAAGGWKPAKFEIKNVGVTVDVTADLKADGSIALHAVPSLVEFMGFVNLDNQKSVAASRTPPGEIKVPDIGPLEPRGNRIKPVFSEKTIDETITLKSGETVALSGFKEMNDLRPFKEAAPKGNLIIFITASVVGDETDANRTGDSGANGDAGRPAPTGNRDADAGSADTSDPAKKMITKEWKVPTDLIPPKPDSDGVEHRSAKDWLVANGVQFAGNATAIYVATTSRLIVRNTQDQLDLVDQLLARKTTASATTPQATPAPAPLWQAYGLRRLEKIIIPKIELREATLTEALDFLRAKAKELDPEKIGVNLVVKPGTTSDARITVSLSNIPLVEALRYFTGLADLEYEVQPNAIVIQPAGVKTAASGGASAPVPVASSEEPQEGPALTKAKTIIFPKIEFREASLPEILDFLRVKSKELDPEKIGVNLVIKPGTTSDAKISLSLTNIPLLEAVHYVVSLADLEYRVQPNAIVIQPRPGKTGAPPDPKTKSSKAEKDEEPVEITADSTNFTQNVALAEGHASLKWGGQIMTAEHIRYDPATRQVELTGKVEIKNGNRLTQAERVTVSLKPDGQMKIEGPHTVNILAQPAAVTLAPKGTFKGGDGIEIRETTGTSPTFRVGGTYHVRGVCRQNSLEHANLSIGNTADPGPEAIQPAGGTSLAKEIPKGLTEFEFAFTPTRPGKLHVTIYDLDNHDSVDNAYAGIYLGSVAP